MDEQNQLIDIASAIDNRVGNKAEFNAEAIVRDYINHGETGLALDMLVDTLCEYDVPITRSEYNALAMLQDSLGSESGRKVWQYLANLILPDPF